MNFLVGAATAGHQVEGNNIHSDFWAMEQMDCSGFAEPSLEAVDHYHRYKEDIVMLKEAGLNAFRFSIEWSRIEPEKGSYDPEAIEHYRNVLKTCRENGVEPIVTLHHFSSPKWLIEQGGWENEQVIADFASYSQLVVRELGEYIHYICTINEANMGLQLAVISEQYMKQMQQMAENTDSMAQIGMNIEEMLKNMELQKKENTKVFGTEVPQTFLSSRTAEGDAMIMRAHVAAREAIRKAAPHIKIGVTLSLHDIQAVNGGEENAQKEWEMEFSHYLPYLQQDDFFGLQNYTRSLVGPDGILPAPEDKKLTQMNYENYPQALEHVIRRAYRELGLPVMVTENGIATEDDTERISFIQEALQGVQNCRKDHIPLIGYLHWSLLDNFEWQKGFGMKFGLVEVDRETQQRKPKESLRYLGICAKEMEEA